MTERLDITVDGVRLACRVSGAPDAPVMVLLHGLGEQASGWDAVAAEFAASYRVYAIDLRGHGESDWPGTYSFELMRDDVVGVLDQLGLDRIILLGHSMGGTVAFLVAQQEPGRVGRLILEDTPPPLPLHRSIPERPDADLPFDWAVLPAIFGQLSSFDLSWWDRLDEITAPTLLIGGGPASHIPQDKIAEAAARLPRATMEVIPAGHHVHAARPAEFAAAVLAFLGNVSRC